MKSRPFINSSIEFLEEEFEKKKTDDKFLNSLVKELGFRKTARAKRLKLEVDLETGG